MDVEADIKVTGLVQGVGFRYHVYKIAVQKGLKGYVRNVPDGSVEIVVQGEKQVIDLFIESVRVGPRVSHISDIQVGWKSPENSLEQFAIR